jgi:hypothetical protein
MPGDSAALKEQARLAFEGQPPHQPGPSRCIFTGDDLEAPLRQERVAPHPPTPYTVWLARPLSDEQLRLVRDAKRGSEESLGGIPGFGLQEAAHPIPKARDAQWTQEGKWREAASLAATKDAQDFKNAAELEVQNVAQNPWGSRAPPRRRGDVFAPFAPRA